MWTPVILTDKATGRSMHITIFEREMFLAGEWSFEDLWEICQPLEEQIELKLECGAVVLS